MNNRNYPSPLSDGTHSTDTLRERARYFQPAKKPFFKSEKFRKFILIWVCVWSVIFIIQAIAGAVVTAPYRREYSGWSDVRAHGTTGMQLRYAIEHDMLSDAGFAACEDDEYPSFVQSADDAVCIRSEDCTITYCTGSPDNLYAMNALTVRGMNSGLKDGFGIISAATAAGTLEITRYYFSDCCLVCLRTADGTYIAALSEQLEPMARGWSTKKNREALDSILEYVTLEDIRVLCDKYETYTLELLGTLGETDN